MNKMKKELVIDLAIVLPLFAGWLYLVFSSNWLCILFGVLLIPVMTFILAKFLCKHNII